MVAMIAAARRWQQHRQCRCSAKPRPTIPAV